MKNKIGKSSELMWILGLVLVALGVTICKKADLGVSMIAAPTFIVYEFVSSLWSGFSVGMVEYIIQGIILIILCACVQRFNLKYILAFLTAVIYGYIMDLWLLILGSNPFEEVWIRWIMLIVGDIVTATGVACFFRTYMPLQVHELFVSEMTKRFNFDLHKTKLVFDMSLLFISIVLALVLFRDVSSFDWKTIGYSSFHSIGLGTIITTFINTPIIGFMGKLFDKIFDYTPLFPKLEKFLNK